MAEKLTLTSESKEEIKNLRPSSTFTIKNVQVSGVEDPSELTLLFWLRLSTTGEQHKIVFSEFASLFIKRDDTFIADINKSFEIGAAQIQEIECITDGDSGFSLVVYYDLLPS